MPLMVKSSTDNALAMEQSGTGIRTVAENMTEAGFLAIGQLLNLKIYTLMSFGGYLLESEANMPRTCTTSHVCLEA